MEVWKVAIERCIIHGAGANYKLYAIRISESKRKARAAHGDVYKGERDIEA